MECDTNWPKCDDEHFSYPGAMSKDTVRWEGSMNLVGSAGKGTRRMLALATWGALGAASTMEACARSNDVLAAYDDAGLASGDVAQPPDADLLGEVLSEGAAACLSAVANKSSVGCEYYAVYPSNVTPGQPIDGCYVAFVTNTSSDAVTISVDFAGQALDVSAFAFMPTGTGSSIAYTPLPDGKLAPNQVALLFLASDTTDLACPKPAASAQIGGSAFGLAPAAHAGLSNPFHIRTDAPVVAYDLYPYLNGGAVIASASLLLPTSVWDTSYVAVGPWPDVPLLEGGILGNSSNSSPPELAVVAQADGTNVTITPSATIRGGPGVPGTPQGTPQTYSLSKGQLLLFQQKDDLTGSRIQSNLPVGVWGLSSGFSIYECCADTAHQQIPPVHALGHEYVGVRYRDRVDGKEETPPWRIVGAVDGTTLSYDPAAPPGAPTTLGLGQVVTFAAGDPFVVRSQDADHPFYLSGHMTGGGNPMPFGGADAGGGEDAAASDGGDASADGASDGGDAGHINDPLYFNGVGDPEFVNVIPSSQYLSSYVFYTDPTYENTSLVLVREKGTSGTFADVKLDCAGVLSGWQPVGTSGAYEFLRFDLAKGDDVGACANGRHQIDSVTPFAVTAWAWVEYSSYAYPAGASVHSVNTIVLR
jgi:hypothetical protein